MAKLEINASDLLGKLHLAALEQVEKNYKGFWKRLKKGNISKSGNSYLENNAFHNNSSQLCPPPNGTALIHVHTSGTKPQSLARDIFGTYMKWFAGMKEDEAKRKFDEYNKNAGLGNSNATKEKGLTEFDINIEYELTSTEKAVVDIEDANDKINNGEDAASKSNKSSGSNNSDIIGMNDSLIVEPTEKTKLWESEHPFEILFNKEDKIMISESKAKKFVKQVVKQKNVDAQKTLEALIKEKVEQRIKDVLDEEKAKK